jgi:tetratricopeptide (TPR) repeat protein
MEKRYEGFLAPNGLYILDSFSGEVRLITHGSNIPTTSISSLSEVSSNLEHNSIIQTNSYSPYENEVISTYPYLISKPFSDLLNETDPRMKCKLMVDAFTAVLKYLALQLASEYIRAKDLKDLQIHQTLTKDLSRPLISAWNLLIARCLPVMNDNKIQLFSPEIKVAYEKLESKCKDPFLVTQSYSDENGEIKTKTKKLGKIQALINYRNGLAHGFNQSQTRAKKEFDEYYPLLCDILQEVRFVSRYTLWHVESSKQGVNGIRLMGASPSMKKVDFDREGVNPAVSPLFLINDATSEILPLYAFFDVDEANETGLPEIGKDVFVFEGNTKNTVIYLSSSGEHLEKSSRFNHWKELLAQKQMQVELVETNNLNLDALHTIAKRISSVGIQALITSSKYLREATIPRQDLNDLLDSFSHGDFNGFVLGGESGIGKSTLLAQKTEEWQAAGHMVTFYRGSALNQSDIANKFLRDCALKVNYFEDFLSVVNTIFSQSGKKCYLIVDALNEYASDLNELIISVENMVAQAANYPWFKLIVSIRDSAYNRATVRFGELISNKYFKLEKEKGSEKIKTNIIRLQPLSKDFVEQLYNAYRDYKWKDNMDSEDEGYYIFRPLTEFSELDLNGSTIQLIRSPLMARLVMQSFHREKLPQQLTNDKAMRLYHDNIVLERSADSLGFPERKKLLNLLVAELDKQSVERVERDELMKNNSLRPYLINSQRDSAYIQLLEIGVLMEEWEAEDCFIRFAFDKFFEFLLAELHWNLISDTEELIYLLQRALDFKILQGAIEIIMERHCSSGWIELATDVADILEFRNESIQNLYKEIFVRVVIQLSKYNVEIFSKLLNKLKDAPSNSDLDILLELAENLFYERDINNFLKVLETAKIESSLLNDKNKILSFLVYEAKYEADEGNLELALEKFQQILTISINAKRLKFASEVQNEMGIILMRKGQLKLAEQIFIQSIELKRKVNDTIGEGRNLNSLGLIKLHRYELDLAIIDFKKALQIFEKHKSMKDHISTFNFLGRAEFEKSNDNEAKIFFQLALNLADKNYYVEAVFGSIHRAFSLMSFDEREKSLIILNKYSTKLKSKRCISLMENILLMYHCFNMDILEPNTISFHKHKVINSKNEFETSEIDDLPIEAFYAAAYKVNQLNAPEEAKELAKQALEWIGNRKTRRKEELEKMINFF